MKIGQRTVSLTVVAGILFRLFGLAVCLWVLVDKATNRPEHFMLKAALLVLVMLWMVWRLYRDVVEALAHVEAEPLSADAQRSMASAREELAQSAERWVCTACGQSTPADYRACIYCGRPSGRMR